MPGENIKTLRRRLRSIKNTKQITRAMEMVSAAKLRRIQTALMAGRPFARKLEELLIHLSDSENAKTNPCFIERTQGKAMIVLITADRGLCGAFNNNVSLAALNFIRQNSQKNFDIYCIGKKGSDYFAKQKFNIIRSIRDFSGMLILERIQEASKEILDKYFSGEYNEIFLVYNSFISTMSYKQRVDKFLPLDPSMIEKKEDNSEKKVHSEFILEPSADQVFNSLVPRYLQAKFYITLAESYTSEHSARMVSMNKASKNCDEMIEKITLKMNKARQASITKELLDIVGGSKAIVDQ